MDNLVNLLNNLAIKDELNEFATKDELKSLATKENPEFINKIKILKEIEVIIIGNK